MPQRVEEIDTLRAACRVIIAQFETLKDMDWRGFGRPRQTTKAGREADKRRGVWLEVVFELYASDDAMTLQKVSDELSPPHMRLTVDHLSACLRKHPTIGPKYKVLARQRMAFHAKARAADATWQHKMARAKKKRGPPSVKRLLGYAVVGQKLHGSTHSRERRDNIVAGIQRSGRAKLTPDDMRNIRGDGRPHYEIMEQYGITGSMVTALKSNYYDHLGVPSVKVRRRRRVRLFSDEQVREIRRAISEGRGDSEIGRDYDVIPQNIQGIRLGQTYADVTQN